MIILNILDSISAGESSVNNSNYLTIVIIGITICGLFCLLLWQKGKSRKADKAIAEKRAQMTPIKN